MNKKKVLLIRVLCLVLIVISVFLISKSVATNDSTILKDQEVDSLLFENANLAYEKGVSTLTVTITNNSKEDYELKTINIKFLQEDDSIVEMIGYVGPVIKSNTGVIMTASIDKDVTSSKELEYSVNK